MKIIKATKDEGQKKKVCCYARVSTLEDEQVSSYESQICYYENMIKGNPNWIYAGTFSDHGISGTGTKKRDGFNEMIAACERGEVDIILTKSLSRFSRNTLDTLQTLRKLKELDVSIRFEKEGIDT